MLLLYLTSVVLSVKASLVSGHIIKTPSTTTTAEPVKESKISNLKPIVSVIFPSEVTSGDNVTLYCDYDVRGRGLYSIRWYFNGEEVYRYKESRSKPSKEVFPASLKGKKFSIDLNGSSRDSLQVINIRTAGQFKCEVTEYETFTSTSVGDRLNVTLVHSNSSYQSVAAIDQVLMMLLIIASSSFMIQLNSR